MTKPQLILLGTARRAAQKATGLEESDYRTILRSVAHCESGKDIQTPEQFERILALLEARGYEHPKGPRHFRNKVGRRNDGAVTEQQLHKIDSLLNPGCTSGASAFPYKLPGLCLRFSFDRTDQVTELHAEEAYNLIEALKQIVARADVARASSPCSQPSLFPTQDSALSTQDSSEEVPF